MSTSTSRLWAWLWIGHIHFFVVYALVASAWDVAFTELRNPISDLAAAECYISIGDGHQVCSPWRKAMGASFIATGILTFLGSLLSPHGRFSRPSKVLFTLASVGFIVVGLTPHLSDTPYHMSGALCLMLCGNIGIFMGGTSSRTSTPLAGRFSQVCGVVGFGALIIMLTTQYFWVLTPGDLTAWTLSWFGLIERIVVYPILFAMIFLGLSEIASARRPLLVTDEPPQGKDNSDSSPSH